MKHPSKNSVGIAVACLSLIAINPAAAQANTGTNPATGNGVTTDTSATTTRDADDYTDHASKFNWLGLLGLLGLVGLKKNNTHRTDGPHQRQ